jgi:hypothetical protein
MSNITKYKISSDEFLYFMEMIVKEAVEETDNLDMDNEGQCMRRPLSEWLDILDEDTSNICNLIRDDFDTFKSYVGIVDKEVKNDSEDNK